MTPQELLQQGIDSGNWELIKKAQDLLKKPDDFVDPLTIKTKIPKKKVIKEKSIPKTKTIVKEKKNAKGQKTGSLKGDAYSLAQYVARFEKERLEQMIQEGGRQVKGGSMPNIDFDNAFKEDKKTDKLLNPQQTRKSTPRDAIEDVARVCPICHQTVHVPSNMVHLYAWSTNSEEGSKVLYRCDRCLG